MNTNSHPHEAFLSVNIRSKLLNISEIARRMNQNPHVFYNRLNHIGRHKPLTAEELLQIEDIIKEDLAI